MTAFSAVAACPPSQCSQCPHGLVDTGLLSGPRWDDTSPAAISESRVVFSDTQDVSEVFSYVLGMTLNCLGRAVRYPLATGHPSGWPGRFCKRCVQVAQPFVFPFLFPFALPAPWAFPRPFVPAGPAWRIEAVDSPSEDDLAKETLALRYPRVG